MARAGVARVPGEMADDSYLELREALELVPGRLNRNAADLFRLAER
jgi:hypothetical protein